MKIGGPEECDDKSNWKRGLVSNSSLWRVTNRKSPPIPLWELLQSQRESFENSALLANAMQVEWEEKGFAKDLTNENILKSLRRDLYLWQQYKPVDNETIVNHIHSLAKIRNKQVTRMNEWFEEVLYLPVVQQTITKAVEIMKTKGHSLECLHLQMSLRSILHPVKQIKTRYFKNIGEIDRFLSRSVKQTNPMPFRTSKITDLPQCLRNAMAKLDVFPEDEAAILRDICLRLELTIELWQHSSLKDFRYLVSLAVLHLHGFSLKDFIFECYLEKADIEHTMALLEESLKKLDSLSSTTDKQAFLLSLVLNSPHQKQLALRFMIDRMPGGVDRWLKSKMKCGSFNIDNIQAFVSNQLSNKDCGENLEVLAQSIKWQFQSVFEGMQIGQGGGKHKEIIPFHLDESADKIFQTLDLKRYYPGKLSYGEVILLSPDILKDIAQRPKDPTELPWYFLKQVVGLNGNIIEDIVQEEVTKSTDSGSYHMQVFQPEKRNVNEGMSEEEGWEEEWEEDEPQNNVINRIKCFDTLNTVHPLDMVCAVFLCADDFLRQELADKMAQCQYAIPFILPLPHKNEKGRSKGNLVLHWGLKSITRTFRTKSKVDLADQQKVAGKSYVEETVGNSHVVHKTMVDAEGPVVSFLSLGEEITWKLKLLNKMISSVQETFWHPELAGGHCQQKMSREMVEVAWYLPGGHINDKFPEPFSFINFRGDGLECPVLSETLIESSSVSCVFTNEVNRDVFLFLKRSNANLKRVILVVLYKGKEASKIDKGCRQLQAKLRPGVADILAFEEKGANFATVLQSLKKSIETLAANNHTSLTEIVSEAKLTTNLVIDDKNGFEGRLIAEDILADIDEYNEMKEGCAKSIVLPCQSNIETRKEMAENDKEVCRLEHLENNEICKYTSEVEDKKWKLVLKQLRYPLSETFMKFLQCVLNLRGSDRNYFMQGLKLGLNERSIKLLQPLREEYRLCRLKENVEANTKELNRLNKELIHGSLGLEHFFREIAVVYENIAALGQRLKSDILNDTLDILATVMADMLLEGTAIELLDGDVVHSPALFVRAILDKIESKEKAKVFRVSALGAQSSGKSTILNTAFGLNFPVSSGRCTRGVYMQLVKIREDLSQQLNCNYLLVIDSEGLMSTLTDRSEYDNELATFVIGVSDLILVIIKGEGNEMQDVLPIAIHAFMRMNKVGEQQACKFVHQNMGAADTENTSPMEIDAFVKLLDEKTLTAAKNTEQSDRYSRFTDVLHYRKKSDDTFVPGLWDGTPPMAKTNVHYSFKMQELKQEVLLHIKEVAKTKEFPTFGQFGSWLDQIWRAIKYENFVFSFKNVFAIEAYNKLKRQYDLWQSDIKKQITDKIVHAETFFPNEAQWIPSGIESKIDDEAISLKRKVKDETDKLQKKINGCFPCDHDRDHQDYCCKAVKISNLHIENKKEFESNIDTLKLGLNHDVLTRTNDLKLKVSTQIRIKQLSRDMDKILKKRVHDLVREQKSKHLADKEITHIFNKMWADATGDIMRQLQWKGQDQKINIKAKIQNITSELLGVDQIENVYWETLKAESGTMHIDKPNRFKVNERHLRLKKVPESWGRKTIGAVVRKVRNVKRPEVPKSECDRLENESKNIISWADRQYSFSEEGKEFLERHAESLLRNVLGKIEKIDCIDKDKVIICKEYKIDLLVHIGDKAVAGFTALHDQYHKVSSPKAKLDKVKDSYLILFRSEMGRGNTAVDFCNTTLKKIVVQNIEKQLTNDELLRELKLYRGDVFDNIQKLQASIMVDLYIAKDFAKYSAYVSQYETVVKEKLQRETVKCLKKEDRLKNLAKTYLGRVIASMIEAINEAVDRFSRGSNLIELFFRQLSNLWIPHDELSGFYEITEIQEKKDSEQFGKLVTEQLGLVKEEISKQIDGWQVCNKLTEKKLTDFLFKKIVGCAARCPFCRVPCDRHSGGWLAGDHFAQLHRPQGLGSFAYSPDGIVMKDLVVESCPVNVASKTEFWYDKDSKKELMPFKKYHLVYPNWEIPPNTDFRSEGYWRYVLAEYNKEWADYYGAEPAKLGKDEHDWKNYTVDDFKAEMKAHYYSTIDI